MFTELGRHLASSYNSKYDHKKQGSTGEVTYNHLQDMDEEQDGDDDEEDTQHLLIDTSTPEALERDFYAWLKGDLTSSKHCYKKCLPSPSRALLPSIDHFNKTFKTEDLLCSQEDMLLSDGQSPTPSSGSSSSYSCASASPLSCTSISVASSSSFCFSGVSGGSLDGLDVAIFLGPIKESKGLGDIGSEELNLGGDQPLQQNRSSGINQLGRTYSPGLPLSMSEREQIIDYYRNGWKICDISKKLCVTHSCVSKILQRFRTTGTIQPKDAKEGRQESPLVAAIRDYRNRLGMTRQSEIREQLILDGVCRRENAPSRSSINHILRTKLDLKRRKKQ